MYILYICHAKVYTYAMQSSLVAHARLAAQDRDFPRIFSVLATERQPTQDWGHPKFHIQVLISQTWLPLRELGPVPSAQLHSKASFCWQLYLYGIVKVAFPSIQSNLSSSSLEHDPLPLQIEIDFFLDFQCNQASKLFNTLVTCPEGSLAPIFHQDSSRCP